MKYLCDTNIFLQVLRSREHASECGLFLDKNAGVSSLTDFSLFTLCLKAEYHHMEKQTSDFLLELTREGMKVLSTPSSFALQALFLPSETGLHFEDAFQYATAKHYGITLITLDGDFLNRKLDIPVKRPGEVA